MHPDVTGGILAGGSSQRMGGTDKALLLIDNRPLVAHVASRLRPFVSKLLINTDSDASAFSKLADAIVADEPAHHAAGPLAGMLALLHASDSEWTIILPCDAPLIPDQVLQQLSETALRTQRPAVVRVQGRVNPVCCVLDKSAAARIESALNQGLQRTQQVILSLAPEFVDHDDDRPGLWSLNTAAELAACEHYIRSTAD